MYSVSWTQSAEKQFSVLWKLSEDRLAIATVARQLEMMLARDPFQVGESRESIDFRYIFLAPVAFRFRIDANRNVVIVEAIWKPN